MALLVSGLQAGWAQVSLNLRNADLNAFIQIVAEATGRNFILDPRVAGTVTIVGSDQIAPADVYDVFLNVLEVNRLTVVRGAQIDRIVPIDTASTLSSSADVQLDGSYETRVIQLLNAQVGEVSEVIRPLLPPEAVLSAVPGSNLLILSDRGTNQERIARVIRQLDQPRQSTLETIHMRNGNAAEMAEVVRGLEILPVGATIAADARSNALVVSGPEAFRDRVRLLVTQLDRPTRSASTQVVTLDYADATVLETVIRRSFGDASAEGGEDAAGSDVTVVAEPQQNALVITASPTKLQSIVQAVQQLDRAPKQVLIEAVIFEISVESFSDLSVQFGAIVNDAAAGGAQFALEGRPTLTGLVTAIVSGSAPNVGDGGVLAGREGDFVAFLSALSSESSTRLLATPSIMTLNNQEARIVVAQNVPFVTGSFATVGDSAVPEKPFQTIQRQDVGLTLTVTPQITADNTVRLAIAQEVSNLTNTASAAGGEITSKREISTNVLIGDGRVLILGGLLENGNGAVSKKVPGLGDLPVLGVLFRGRNANEAQRVLLVMLRPRIVHDAREATRLTRQLAREARIASVHISPDDPGGFPGMPETTLPFDGADLNQPFGAGLIDDAARRHLYPPLPDALVFPGK